MHFNAFQVWRPRLLKTQFLFAISGLAVLMLAGGVTAIYALHSAVASTKSLAEERLLLMQQAQDLVEQTFLIEREAYLLSGASSIAATTASYTEIVKHVEAVDHLVDQLAKGGDDVAVIELHQAAQLFRNTANIMAQLRENELRAPGLPPAGLAQGGVQDAVAVAPFRAELQRQSKALVDSARQQSTRFTQDYRVAVRELAETSVRNQRWITGLLVVSLALAWLVGHGFLGRQVLARLQKVSHSLRHGDPGEECCKVPVQGADEIGEMARAVEQFQADRVQLAVAHQTLKLEKTRQDELIRKLADAQSQLLQSEKMASIGQLAAGVAHEINNPVGFVNSNLGTLKRYVDETLALLSAYEQSEAEMPDETRRALAGHKARIDLDFLREDIASVFSESQDGLQRVIRIVKDLKTFSHVDEAEKQWANLEQGLDSTLNVVSHDLKYTAEVRKEYGGIPDIECLPFQLNQVFLNLLVNAGQAIEGRGRIVLRTGHDEDLVWVEVEDSGKGIPEADLERIFEPFFTTKPVGTGTGLGLSLSYGIVAKHGGKIAVRSEVGKGSVFRVSLPRRAVLSPAAAQAAA
ncbi:histidine kinase [Herbaspirillum hiltneri N3]|uniref:histidine kinase n=1 Tax=Herbaspirillum hiltneri N3 TaxID=1262470 RepID=A0ABM5V3P1_9BURK|nr:ATP-binding protein [Herbaspirillum hiltneri]AKZ64224.1 histidine kinase [Herbaspirillum hiltneri N3]